MRGARRIAPASIDRTCNTCSRRRRDQPIDGDTPTEGESAAEFDRKALVEDARALVAALEAIHPDPYVGYDGRVGLHARLERIARDPPGTATVEEFYRRAAPLVASMNDSHSRLQPPTRDDSSDGSEGDRRLPVSLRVVGDRLYVESVFDGALDDLLGARLLAVEGELVGTLADRVAALRGAENEYTALLFAARTIEDHGPLARLLDRPASPTEPMIRVEVDGEKRSVALTPVAAEREPTGELDETFPHPIGTGPRYRLYEGGDIAVFVPGDLSGYRESFEVSMDRDAGRVTDLAPVAYDRYVGGDRPDDLAATVVALPSVTETLIEMSDETAAAGTDVLIIDLRTTPAATRSPFSIWPTCSEGGRAFQRRSSTSVRSNVEPSPIASVTGPARRKPMAPNPSVATRPTTTSAAFSTIPTPMRTSRSRRLGTFSCDRLPSRNSPRRGATRLPVIPIGSSSRSRRVR